MSQVIASVTARTPLDPGTTELPGLPHRPLNASEQVAALRRVQAQAEHRVKLGVQLFKAAEARVAQQQSLADQVRAEQRSLRSQIQDDVARAFKSYDQRIGDIENQVGARLEQLERKLDQMEQRWRQAQTQVEQVLRRAESLLEQVRPEWETPVPESSPPRTVSIAPPSEVPEPPAMSDDAPVLFTDILRRLGPNAA